MLLMMFLLPILGSILMLCGKFRDNSSVTRLVPLVFTFLELLLSVFVSFRIDYSTPGFQFVQEILGCRIGVDAISMPMLLLSSFLFFVCVLGSSSIKDRVGSYMGFFLLLQGFIVAFFISINVFLFYVFFEAVLIPMFFIIGIWGGEFRRYAAFKFFLYTAVGSLTLLVSILYLYSSFGTSDLVELAHCVKGIDPEVAKWLWIGAFIAFAIKVPVFPFHTWLPDAHVQAPTSGSVILAGILLKMGGYGMIRFLLYLLPGSSAYFSWYVILLSVLSVIYTSFVAFAQKDLKKLIAYSSVAHMGFVTAGIFSLNMYSVSGAIFQMVSHGLISSALFLCVGLLYSRVHTLEISKYSGIAGVMPRFTFVFFLFCMAAVGLPGTSGFIGELLPMLGVFCNLQFFTFFFACGIVLSAIYMLNLCRSMIWGVLPSEGFLNSDINVLDFSILLIFAALIVLLGIFPSFFLGRYLTPVLSSMLVPFSPSSSPIF